VARNDLFHVCRFDMGEILYAVNSMKCPKGRQILWGWLQVRTNPCNFVHLLRPILFAAP
jgi:hypothetical protein